MGKFSLGKKSSAVEEDDPNRSSLFGSRSSKGAPVAPPSSNPYAQQQSVPDPYLQDTNKYAGMGSAYVGLGTSTGPGALPSAVNRSSAANDGGRYGASSDGIGPRGYGADRPDGNGGPAGSRYGPTGSQGLTESRYGPGGYGGLGRTNSHESTATDVNREALFGGASNRYQQRSVAPQTNGQAAGGYGPNDGYDSTPGTYGDGGSGYGAYGENRQLTAEEEEEEDVQAAKQQIRLMKREDVASTRNALRIAAQAEETGRGTLERLAAQGERIHNTERNLDLATNHNRIAEERAKELKTLNKSMFAMHVANPFTKGDRRRRRDEDVINKHRAEREQRDITRAAAFASRARVEDARRDTRDGNGGLSGNKGKASLAERAKYQFEADSEDDEMEKEIDSNLDAMNRAAGRLNAVARATGKEVDEQNRHIETIIAKVGASACEDGWMGIILADDHLRAIVWMIRLP